MTFAIRMRWRYLGIYIAPTLAMIVIVFKLPWLSAALAGEALTWGQPYWLVDPSKRCHNLIQVHGVEFDRSNTNIAIRIFKDRLYCAIRTAPHHAPRPFINDGINAGAPTRLYLLSTNFGTREIQKIAAGEAVDWNWKLELEVSKRLRPRLSNLRQRIQLGGDGDSTVLVEAESLVGKMATDRYTQTGVLLEPDLREPLLFELNGRLHFLVMQIASTAYEFMPLRAWHMESSGDGKWSAPEPILAPGDHYWDVVTRSESEQQLAYLTLAKGNGHYQFGTTREQDGIIDLRKSSDGRAWRSVSKAAHIDRGRACEPAIGFSPNEKTAWMLLRCEDADHRGWGSLLGSADAKHLDQWTFPNLADARRFDSARFVNVGGETYVIARQNVTRSSNGAWDCSNNFPYGTGTVPPKRLADAISATLMWQYWHLPKRTAIYRLKASTRQLDYVATLPSAGDTAFPSIERLGPDTLLLANYSSALDRPDLTWYQGQNQRTGVYLLVLRFGDACAAPSNAGDD